MTTTVRRAGPGDLARCAEVLGAAFADSPWTQWCVEATDHVERITALQRISLELLGLPFGLVWVAECEQQVVSVAAWSDSRVDIDRAVFTSLGDRSRPFHGDRLAAAYAAEQGSHPRPDTDHLFLETIGTAPTHWRRGFGVAVLTPGLAIADRRKIPCALETSTEGNVEFYRRIGFEIVDHRVIAGGGPDVWAMWRLPAGA